MTLVFVLIRVCDRTIPMSQIHIELPLIYAAIAVIISAISMSQSLQNLALVLLSVIVQNNA